MSKWAVQFKSHPFNGVWKNITNLLRSDDFEKNNSKEAMIDIARLNKVAAYIDSVLENTDPELFSIHLLNAFNSHATNLFNELNAFNGNQNIAHLTNANNHMDQLLMFIGQTPFSLQGQQKGAITRAATAYAETVDKYIEKLKKTVDEYSTTLDEKLNTVIAGINEKSVAHEEKLNSNKQQLDELLNGLKSVKQTIESQTAEFNTQFQSSENTRADKFDSVVTKLQDKADSTFEKLVVKSGLTITALDKLQENAAKIYGVVTNTIQAGAYSSYANEEKKHANRYRIYSLIFMLLGVAFLIAPEFYKIIQDISTYQLDWKNVLGRAWFSVVLFIPAFYLAKESNKHRNNEVINRRRELILSTIDPYLALLNEGKAEEIKVEIAKGIFSEGSAHSGDNETDTSNVLAQISNMLKQFKGMK